MNLTFLVSFFSLCHMTTVSTFVAFVSLEALTSLAVFQFDQSITLFRLLIILLHFILHQQIQQYRFCQDLKCASLALF